MPRNRRDIPRRLASEKSFSARCNPWASCSGPMSRSKTSLPRAANHWAMPAPITPEPITAVFSIDSAFGAGRCFARSWRKKMRIRFLETSPSARARMAFFSAARDCGMLRTTALRDNVNGAQGGRIMSSRFLQHGLSRQRAPQPATQESTPVAETAARLSFGNKALRQESQPFRWSNRVNQPKLQRLRARH